MSALKRPIDEEINMPSIFRTFVQHWTVSAVYAMLVWFGTRFSCNGCFFIGIIIAAGGCDNLLFPLAQEFTVHELARVASTFPTVQPHRDTVQHRIPLLLVLITFVGKLVFSPIILPVP